MRKIRFGLIVLWILAVFANSAAAQISIGIGLPNLSIGINLPVYPELAPVPGYPVYYAPQVDGNYFFYDGMYWVYQNDTWYASSWYNGPWGMVEPEVVPLFILRIPVRYYRQPPAYFSGWSSKAPPRWGQHWGKGWEQRRGGWDKWNRKTAPGRAPLPAYQREYSGERYPRAEQQHALHTQQYRYQPRNKVVRQHLKQQGGQSAPAPAQYENKTEPQTRHPGQQDTHGSLPRQLGAPADPHSQPPQRGGEYAQNPAPGHTPPQQRGHETRGQGPQPQPGGGQHEQQDPRLRDLERKSPDRGEPQESKHGRGQGENKDEDRGHGR